MPLDMGAGARRPDAIVARRIAIAVPSAVPARVVPTTLGRRDTARCKH